MTLYEMTAAGRALLEMLEAGEIDEQTFADTLESIGADEKVDTYCEIIAQRKADAEVLRGEIERLTAKKKAAENDIDRMRRALAEFMLGTGQQKLKTQLFSCSISSRASVNITDESIIPTEYKIPQPDKIDKAGILKMLKSGETVSGAEIVFNDSLTIR